MPDWLALIEQVPAATSDSVLPLTLHTAGLVDAKLTGKPELALATRAAGRLPRVWSAGLLKLMVWASKGAAPTVNACTTGVAAAKPALPAWLALMLQVPSATSVKLLPLTVQTPGVVDARATARLALLVATKAGGGLPSVWLPGEAKLMDWASSGAAATAKLRDTAVAAAKTALPGWLALRLQVPTASSVKLLPLTPQTLGVLDARLTGKPELALATSAGGAVPSVWLAGAAKLRVWLACNTAKLAETALAAAYTALPAWLAVTLQVPADTSVSALPLTPQTAGVAEARLTARPELAVAVKAAGALPRVWEAGTAKLMDCGVGSTRIDTSTGAAAAKSALPPWLATSVQVPAATSTRVLPLLLQTAGLLLAKLTARPELAVATRAAVGLPKVWLPGAVTPMVCAVGSTVKVWITAAAAAKRLSPAWLAATLQAPAAFSVSVVPATLQMSVVVATKLTARPELAVAANAGAGLPRVWVASAAKLIDCDSRPEATAKLWLASGAAMKLALPGWAASSVQVPRPSSVNAVPLTLQTAGVREAKPTARPELAVATSAAGAVLRAWLPGATKVMRWSPAATSKLLVKGAAGAKLGSPACWAVSVQVPTLSKANCVPLTPQTAGVVDDKVTGRPDDAVATKGAGADPKRCAPGAAKAMVCGSDWAAGSAPPPQDTSNNRPAQAPRSAKKRRDK